MSEMKGPRAEQRTARTRPSKAKPRAPRQGPAAKAPAARRPPAKARFFNRELSWLDFNERVLAIAEDPHTPLLERAKFLAIFAGNLDEFYMVRVAGLKSQVEAGLTRRSADGLTPKEQLSAIAAKVLPQLERHAVLFAWELMPALAEENVRVLRWNELDDVQRKQLNELFMDELFPVLTPLAVDSGRPFPYISNLSLNLAVLVRDHSAAACTSPASRSRRRCRGSCPSAVAARSYLSRTSSPQTSTSSSPAWTSWSTTRFASRAMPISRSTTARTTS